MKLELLSPLGPMGARLLAFLAAEITSGRVREGRPETFVTYAAALQGIGASGGGRAGQQLSQQGLKELDIWTRQSSGLPKICALVVNKRTQRPSEAFFDSHDVGTANREEWWLGEARRAIDFDWSPYLVQPEEASARVREDGLEIADFRSLVTVEPRPARLRQTKITVAEVLRWLASGQSESEILERHPALHREDILASLAYAADREARSVRDEKQRSRLSEIARKWEGNFTLPKSDSTDPRRDVLLRKYWSDRK